MKVAIYYQPIKDDQERITLLTDYCKEQGWEVVELYCDMKQTMADAAKGNFAVLLTWSWSRMTRNWRELHNVAEHLRGIGIDIISYREKLNTGSPSSMFLFAAMNAVREWEQKEILESARNGK